MRKLSGRSFLITLLFLSFPALHSQAQTKKEFVKAVQQADVSFYYDENYELAASRYEVLYKQFPENNNLATKLGMCYLNIDGKTGEALKLLSIGVKNVVKNDAEYTEIGDKSPLDTYLYLAVAYHHSDSLQKAILLYADAKKRLGNSQLFRNDYIDNQIRDCKYAIEMQKNPQPVSVSLFVPWLKDYEGASTPVLSLNDSVFVFSVKKDGKSRIYCSYNSKGWKKPTEITRQLGADIDSWPNSITADGKTLIIYKSDGGDGNLYISQRTDSTWSKAKNLGKTINTVYWESHGFITPDGKSIYFASNCPGGKGELDIWKSDKDLKGNWGKPANLGSTINTPYNENTPFLDVANKTLYFSSVGLLGMGSYDVYRSVSKNGSWTKPLGIPYSFNTTLENIFFITPNTFQGFITSLYDEKAGSRNIFALKAEDVVVKKIYAFGTVILQDGLPVDPALTEIKLFDNVTGAFIRKVELNNKGAFNFDVNAGDFRIMISAVDKKYDTLNRKVIVEKPIIKNQTSDTGSFVFEIKPGDYQLHISHTGYKTDTINIIIPLKMAGTIIPVISEMVPEKVAEGKFLSINNILFGFNSFELSETAISSVMELRSILLSYPELRLEVAGYTDSKGNADYNMKLADKRAQAIIDLLVKEGISSKRMVKKAFGSSEFTARNTNADGTDNPEGRKYNRRATFGIINPKTGVVIRQDTYTPKHLRSAGSVKYCIVLAETKKSLSPSYFSKMKTSEVQFISSVPTDSITYYILGDFYNKSEALTYLNFAKSNGFREAYISDRYRIGNEQATLLEVNTVEKAVRSNQSSGKIYSIQLAASRVKLDTSQFSTIENLKEIYSEDGYYRYVSGEFVSFREASSALKEIQNKGFTSAYVRDLNTIIPK
jgi:outer membrane protein OmpA-like peptidoglycan-associated protein